MANDCKVISILASVHATLFILLPAWLLWIRGSFFMPGGWAVDPKNLMVRPEFSHRFITSFLAAKNLALHRFPICELYATKSTEFYTDVKTTVKNSILIQPLIARSPIGPSDLPKLRNRWMSIRDWFIRSTHLPLAASSGSLEGGVFFWLSFGRVIMIGVHWMVLPMGG